MELQGEADIPAPLEEVWNALQDPDVLKECIDGCQEMSRSTPTDYVAKIRAHVGPVRANFSANIRMVDVVELSGYTLEVSATGGAAGFGKGVAHISLQEEESSTKLSYEVSGIVGGKLAQIGSRLINGVTNKMAAQFFAKFVERWTENA